MIEVPILERAKNSLGYFDDLSVGDRFFVGKTSVSREAALEFAAAFDPLPFHIDDDAAQKTIFEGLILSGLQILATVQSLRVRGGFFRPETIVCGAGIDELRFTHPVRPGDTLSVSAEILELSPPRRAGGHGFARAKYFVENQKNIIVTSFIDVHVMKMSPELSHT